jgi:hypothetical protein
MRGSDVNKVYNPHSRRPAGASGASAQQRGQHSLVAQQMQTRGVPLSTRTDDEVDRIMAMSEVPAGGDVVQMAERSEREQKRVRDLRGWGVYIAVGMGFHFTSNLL